MNKSTEMTPREHTLRMVLMIAACFAIGSFGVFAAVYLQSISQKSAIEASSSVHQLTLTDAQKEAVLASLSTSNASSTAAASYTANNNVPSGQADIHDPQAAMKLKVLESLSAR